MPTFPPCLVPFPPLHLFRSFFCPSQPSSSSFSPSSSLHFFARSSTGERGGRDGGRDGGKLLRQRKRDRRPPTFLSFLSSPLLFPTFIFSQFSVAGQIRGGHNSVHCFCSAGCMGLPSSFSSSCLVLCPFRPSRYEEMTAYATSAYSTRTESNGFFSYLQLACSMNYGRQQKWYQRYRYINFTFFFVLH